MKTSISFYRHDITVTANIQRIILPKSIKTDAQSNNIYINKKLAIVSSLSNQYFIVKKLVVVVDFSRQYCIENGGNGILIEEITAFLIRVCESILPLNIVTNSLLTANLICYIFSQFVSVNDFESIPAICYNNTKQSPKVIVWNLYRSSGNVNMSMEDILYFIKSFPEYNRGIIKFSKKHVYLPLKTRSSHFPFYISGNITSDGNDVDSPLYISEDTKESVEYTVHIRLPRKTTKKGKMPKAAVKKLCSLLRNDLHIMYIDYVSNKKY